MPEYRALLRNIEFLLDGVFETVSSLSGGGLAE